MVIEKVIILNCGNQDIEYVGLYMLQGELSNKLDWTRRKIKISIETVHCPIWVMYYIVLLGEGIGDNITVYQVMSDLTTQA